jgi:putative endonuclease
VKFALPAFLTPAPQPAMLTRGAQAELLAAQFLQRQGLKLLLQNYRCRYGEIDLILQEGKTLVFVEVRLRSRRDFGGAGASIDTKKQTKLIRTAQHYLGTLLRIPPCRFDAVLLHTLDGSNIEWIKNAFEA